MAFIVLLLEPLYCEKRVKNDVLTCSKHGINDTGPPGPLQLTLVHHIYYTICTVVAKVPWLYLWELRITFWRMYWTSHQCRMTQIIIIILHLWHLARLGLYAYIRVLGLSGTYLTLDVKWKWCLIIRKSARHWYDQIVVTAPNLVDTTFYL